MAIVGAATINDAPFLKEVVTNGAATANGVHSPNGVNGTNGVNSINGVDGHAATQYEVTDQPLGVIKPLRIITIGAGASGINMAYQTKKHLKNIELVCYEKNPKIGGTWYENRYPGCKCDIPSHNYQFTWEPNPNWSGLFSTSSEIQAYLEHCAKKHDLNSYFKLSHAVVGATWDEAQSIWRVKVEDTQRKVVFEDWCHFLLNAGGILNHWKWPDIPGLRSFEGQLIHSANWPADADLQDKNVAVIGNGSTGIQIVPAIQPYVKHLTHLIRSPTWVTPGAASRYPSLRGGTIPDVFSEEQKAKFRNDPVTYSEFVKQIEREINAKFRMIINGAAAAEEARQNAHNSMVQLLGTRAADLGPKIIPEFPVGCRRITPGVGYLESFSKPNVRVITEAKIDRVEPRGIVLDTGELIELDVLVCATGFDVSFSPRFPVTGRNKADLGTLWSEPNVPRAYLSLAIPDFPNYFMFLGPNAPISHGSVFTITENVSQYILQIVTKAQVEMIKTINVKQQAVDDFAQHVDVFMPRTAWAGNCRSWFKRGKIDGPVTAIHPGSRVHWFHTLERPKFEDFDYEYDTNNRFQYLGNGFSIREEDGGDNTWYLDQVAPKYLYY
ncbi:Flavin monooxygenase-like protein [Niveomyces insectorum RCEF 264]|uniref:Flavin monooxygenase-like protein n=1 Tax=Niveomyces insectorum RCEF 264 TaxID=1081102 RepID=A0A167T443_9HYPO|nr:Flavin monooxygenase-like protein [Niveomyces insectorum RCEF 264]